MEENNDLEIIYEPPTKNDQNIKIFGKDFVNYNKDKLKIIYNDGEYELKEYFDEINEIYNKKDLIILKLKGINSLTNMDSMFYGCKTLLSLSGMSNLNIINITSISNMFRECIALKSLPDISKWNTSNIINIEYIFSGCSSLLSLPDISKWNISKINSMNSLY